MPKLNQKGAVVQILMLLILIGGAAAGLYLLKTGNLKIFSKASNPPVVFKSLDGKVLPLNKQGIPYTIESKVQIELTSTVALPESTPAPTEAPQDGYWAGIKSPRAGGSAMDQLVVGKPAPFEIWAVGTVRGNPNPKYLITAMEMRVRAMDPKIKRGVSWIKWPYACPGQKSGQWCTLASFKPSAQGLNKKTVNFTPPAVGQFQVVVVAKRAGKQQCIGSPESQPKGWEYCGDPATKNYDYEGQLDAGYVKIAADKNAPPRRGPVIENSNITSTQKVDVEGGLVTPPPAGGLYYRVAEDPAELEKAEFLAYSENPTVISYEFKDQALGNKFIFVDFKDSSGKTDRRSAQIELVSPDKDNPTPTTSPQTEQVSPDKDNPTPIPSS